MGRMKFIRGSGATLPAVALLLLLLSPWPALAESQVFKGDAEGWVKLVELPEADSKFDSQIKNGRSNLLSDYQIRHRLDGYEVFDRYAYRIVDRTGLEQGATIRFDFDPATLKVTMNRLHIVREGVVIDRLPEAKLDIFRREKDAEKGIFDGWLTAYVHVDDVRVGDVIDFARTSIRTPIVGPDLFFHRFGAEWDEPVALIRETVTWPAIRPLNIRSLRTEVRPAIKAEGSWLTYLWEITNPAPVKYEEHLPADYAGNAQIEVSSASTWQDIVDAVLPHYRLDQELPDDFAATLDDLARRYSTAEDRMTEAMRLVQDTIRYVSLSMGSGSYIPRSPATVVASGFGDCKDKALLLATSLRRLGIEAEAALTDLRDGPALPDVVPSLHAFDHVIVKATVDDQIYWIDATNYLQGGRAPNLVAPDYGFAVPIIPAAARVEKIERKELFQPTTFVDERFEFPRSPGEPLKLEVNTIYRDVDADRMRIRLISESAPKLASDYLNYYNRQYPGMEGRGQLKTSDDRDSNVVSVTETYELPADALEADELVESFPLKADIGIGNLPEPDAVGRSGPVALGSPMFKRHRATVTNLKARFVGPDDTDDVITPYTAFKARWTSTSNKFEVDWFFKTLSDRVPAANVGRYLKSLKKMNRNSSWNYNFAYVEPVTD
jgi:transglutaminase-like putative cysteine protease